MHFGSNGDEKENTCGLHNILVDIGGRISLNDFMAFVDSGDIFLKPYVVF